MAFVDLSKYDNFFFDCDGVVWNGSKPISGSIETLCELDRRGKRVYFVTNNASSTQSQIAQKISKMGYQCQQSQVFSSGKATAIFLRKRYPEINTVFLIGQPSYKSELESLGLRVLHSSDWPKSRITSVGDLRSLQPDPSVQAVVLGTQMSFDYQTAYYASMCIQRGAKFVASNCDPYFFIHENVRMIGCGSFVAFLESATDHSPEIVGKPSPFFMEWAQETEHVDLQRSLMLGDTLSADIQFARNAGLDSALVLSGVSEESEVATSPFKPTYVLPRVSSLLPS